MKTKPTARTHPFMPSPALAEDHNGHHYCATCGLPETNAAHRLPDTPADARTVDQRRLGEAGRG